jgi:salicylate hydroxylase
VYLKYRQERGTKVQITSYEAGELYEFHGPNGEGEDIEKLKASLETRMGWIWEYDVEANLSAALGELKA